MPLQNQRRENSKMNRWLCPPEGEADVVLDTDAYNEVDDQFAIAYLLQSVPKLRTKAIYAAPFWNERSSSPDDGMEKSYEEIYRLLKLMGREEVPVFRGSTRYLPSEKEAVISPAAEDLGTRAMHYSSERPLYVVAIGAITNIASALLLYPQIKDRIVVVWLGGHALSYQDNYEFNLYQDIAAARIVFGCGVPLVQLPCQGVVGAFTLSREDLKNWFCGTKLGEYLSGNTLELMDQRGFGPYASKVIWDVTAVAWLLDREGHMMDSRLIPSPIPEYDHHWGFSSRRHLIRYVTMIHKNELMEDLVKKLNQPV